MEELLKDWIGTIAVLIYILYPILKRWLDRRKQRQSQSRGGVDPAESSRTPAPPATGPTPRAPPVPSTEPTPSPAPAVIDAGPSPEQRLMAILQQQAEQLTRRGQQLLTRANQQPQLARLAPVLRDDVLGRVRAIQMALKRTPPISTLTRDAQLLSDLTDLLGYLERMARQRMQQSPTALGDADRMADACYAPILEFARSQGLRLRTSTPVVVIGDWQLSIIPRFASTRVAPIRAPKGFASDILLWPALAHEVAHDLYYSVDGLEADLHRRLDLPHDVRLPDDYQDVDREFVRALPGAWLSVVFADIIGTLTLGPAYVENMRHAFRDPESPHRTAAIFQTDGFIDPHPPRRLRIYIGTRVLHHLGRHEEADSIWARWEAEHQELDLYFLPLGGRWVGLNQDTLHARADAVVDLLIEEPWPELDGYALTDIPGFAYLHPAHTEVARVMQSLRTGDARGEDVRWIMAAAVLLVVEDPALHDEILAAAQRSIVGVGAEAFAEELVVRIEPQGSVGALLSRSLTNAATLREAIILGESIRPYRRPRWR